MDYAPSPFWRWWPFTMRLRSLQGATAWRGFSRVDIFFVINARFLITQQIYPEIVEGRFSVLQFYDRRARRILPALFASALRVLAHLVSRSHTAVSGTVTKLLIAGTALAALWIWLDPKTAFYLVLRAHGKLLPELR